MPALSAPGDTWGISGPDFLLVYLGAAAVFLVVAIVARLSVTRSNPGAAPGRLPTPAEVAFLLGGRTQAAYSSLARLRTAGVIGVGAERGLTVTGPVPAGANRLDLAVYAAAQRDVRARDLPDHAEVQSAVAEISDTVERAGWLPESSIRTRARLGAFLLLGLTAFGVVRIVAGAMNERDVGFLVALCVMTLAFGLSLLRVPRLTALGPPGGQGNPGSKPASRTRPGSVVEDVRDGQCRHGRCPLRDGGALGRRPWVRGGSRCPPYGHLLRCHLRLERW